MEILSNGYQKVENDRIETNDGYRRVPRNFLGQGSFLGISEL